jgi:hypothetical protein
MHGGASTGPRTEAGRARIRAAQLKHGGYAAAGQQAQQRLSALIRQTRAALAALRKGDEAAAMAALELPAAPDRPPETTATPHAT